MPSPNSINAIRNLNSGVIFVLLEENNDRKMTIINPEGKILTVPEGLFAPPFSVRVESFQEQFTNKQIETIGKYFQKKPARPSGATSVRRLRQTLTKKKIDRPLKGIGAEWNSPKLTFYKHKIEPLMESQEFKINIEQVGSFVISKSDFCKWFNDVVISSSYWSEGAFTYINLPEKAKKFIHSN